MPDYEARLKMVEDFVSGYKDGLWPQPTNIGRGQLSQDQTKGGRYFFGLGNADYLDNNVLHFDVPPGGGAVEFEVGSGPKAQLSGFATGSDSNIGLTAQVVTPSNATPSYSLSVGGGASGITWGYDNGIGVFATTLLKYDNVAGARAMYAPTRLYPGAQVNRYISDDGTYTSFSDGIKSGGAFYPNNQTAVWYSSLGASLNLASAISGSAGTIAGWLVMYINSGGPYKFPYYNT